MCGEVASVRSGRAPIPTTTPARQMSELSLITSCTTLAWLAPMARRIPISRVRSMIVVYMASSTTRNEITTAMPVRACLNCLRPMALSCITFETWATGVILWPLKRSCRAWASLSASRAERPLTRKKDACPGVPIASCTSAGARRAVRPRRRGRSRDREVAVDHGQLVAGVDAGGVREDGVHHEVVGLLEGPALHDVEASGDAREGRVVDRPQVHRARLALDLRDVPVEDGRHLRHARPPAS